jgi:hypothetical protein
MFPLALNAREQSNYLLLTEQITPDQFKNHSTLATHLAARLSVFVCDSSAITRIFFHPVRSAGAITIPSIVDHHILPQIALYIGGIGCIC